MSHVMVAVSERSRSDTVFVAADTLRTNASKKRSSSVDKSHLLSRANLSTEEKIAAGKANGKITCWSCGAKGHVTGECRKGTEEERNKLAFKPASRHAKKGKEKTTVGVIDVDKAAVGEYTDDEGDEPIANDTAVFAFQSLSVLMSRFSTDLVLFDNQAGRVPRSRAR